MGEKKQVDLTIENKDYSRHIAAGDGETWVVVREKKRVEAAEITEITGISPDKFTWDVYLQETKRRLYKGTLGLHIKWGLKRMSEIRPVLSDAAYDEARCRQLFSSAARAALGGGGFAAARRRPGDAGPSGHIHAALRPHANAEAVWRASRPGGIRNIEKKLKRRGR